MPRQNPRVQDAQFQALDAYVGRADPSPNISFTVRAEFDEAQARLSWIRSAYLATFAALGWIYSCGR